MSSAWADLIPYNGGSGGYYSYIVLGLLYDHLVAIDNTGAISPRGADSWELADDRKSITFHLSEKAQWSDGQKVTADDYVFAVKEITDPTCNANQKSLYNILDGTDNAGNATGEVGVKEIDDYTVQYRFKTPVSEDINFTQNFVQWIALPEHLLKDVAPADYLTADLWSAPVGNGPCIFKSTVPGAELIVTSNPNFELGAPNFDELRIEVMAASNLAPSIISGDLDICYPGLSADDIAGMQGLSNVKIKKMDTPTGAMMIFINQLVYKDKRINQALSLATNREAIAAMLKNAVAVESPINQATKYYDADIKPEYNPEKAKELLAEAAADGSIDLSQPIVLCTPGGVREQIANILQQNFQDIGLTVQIQVEEAATMFAGLYDGSTAVALVGIDVGTNPMYLKSMLTNDAATMVNISDDTWDDFYDSFLAATSDEERENVMKQYQEKWVEEEPIIFMTESYADYPYASRMGDNGKRLIKQWIVPVP